MGDSGTATITAPTPPTPDSNLTTETPAPAAAATPITKTIYIGPFVHCKTLKELDICEFGAIGVDEGGKIAFVERMEEGELEGVLGGREEWKEAKRVRVKGEGFFFPGFVDTHHHAPQHPNLGLFGTTTLLSWLSTYTFPREASLSSLPLAQRTYTRAIRRTLSHGTTSAAYYATIHVPATIALARICLSHGQRALIGRVCMDALSPDWYRDVSTATALSDTRACIAAIEALDGGRGLVGPVLTPRFAPSCTPALLSGLGALAQETNLPIQTHISENTGEIALVKELFPDAASYADVYDAHALLTPRTILAHAVHLTPAETALIAARGAKVAHCPCSNTALTSGAAPVRELLDAGIGVGLGTDVSGGYSPSVLEMCRHAVLVSRHRAIAMGEGEGGEEGKGGKGGKGGKEGEGGKEKEAERAKLSVAEVLGLATRGGAGVVGLEGVVGAFEVGMEWDAQMVGLGVVGEGEGDGSVDGAEELGGPVDIFGWESWEDKVAKWVFCGDDRNTVAVWVRGRLVHETAAFSQYL